jgi:hypothetical protein
LRIKKKRITVLGMNKGKKATAQDEEEEESNCTIGNEQGEVNYY